MMEESALLEMIENIQTLSKLTAHTPLTDLARGENFILAYLEKHGGTSIPCEISKDMEVSKARISATVHLLEDKQYIIREIDPSDKRRVRIRLTEAGKKYLVHRRRQTYENATFIFDSLGEDDLNEYIRLTNKIISIAKSKN